MRILIKYATRGRKTKFLARMKEIESRTKTDNYKVIVTIDEDDSEMMSILPLINTMKNTAGYVTKPFGKIHAINEYIPWYDKWDVLVNYSDDFTFIQNWDEVMLNTIKSVWPNTTDYSAHFSDGHVFERLPTMVIMGREYAERFGYIYHPSYKSVSCDAEHYYVSLMLKKYSYFPTVIAKHDHPVNNKDVAYDETYKQNDKYADQDTATYFKRMKQNFYVNNPSHVPFEKEKR